MLKIDFHLISDQNTTFFQNSLYKFFLNAKILKQNSAQTRKWIAKIGNMGNFAQCYNG
jgi:hypothetical protein